MPEIAKEDAEFLDNALDNFEEKNAAEQIEDELNADVKEELSAEEVSAIEEKLGRKITDEEKTELLKPEVTEIDDFETIDPNKLPKELQGHFKKMLASFTKKMQGIADVRKKAEVLDYIEKNPEFFVKKYIPQLAQPVAQVVEGTKGAEEKFVDQLGLPEDAEWTPAFKMLALAVAKMATGIEQSRTVNEQTSFKEKWNVFQKTNTGIETDLELVRTMDNLGKENPRLYNDLDRLKKFAETELGRPAKIVETKVKENIYKIYKDMQSAKKSAVRKPETVNKEVTVKQAKNVKEAMEQAIDQLKRERK